MRLIVLLLAPLVLIAQEIKVYAIVTGKVIKVHVKEGDRVKKGQILMEIDPSLYIAEKRRLLGRKAEIKARLWKAERDYRRLRELFERDLLAETRLEDQKIRYDTLKAQMDQVEGELMRIETLIGYTKIYAPVDGIVKRILAPEGSYVNGRLQPQVVILISR
ncbi:MAG: efflux RND transporter periplasmic adaptor subunit [Aquificota bacterium]|nr:efflux RND transporter periplasmic adaptor subunit [Aquificota bacterium]